VHLGHYSVILEGVRGLIHDTQVVLNLEIHNIEHIPLKFICSFQHQLSVLHSKSVYSDDTEDEKYNIPQSTVFEDNNACLQFAQMPRLTPRTKHIGIPYHWFRSYVDSRQVTLVRVDTANQLADQFTKGLPTPAFRIA
jgi:hypothetical protein